MFCPYCGSFNAEENTVCCRCGGAFRIKKIQSTAVETPVTAEAPCPKGRIWPPLLVLIVMFAVGLTLFFTIRPAASGATDPAMPWFTVRDGELYFDESRYVGDSELAVPDTIMGQPITAIAESCFSGCSRLTGIFLPEGIQSIGDRAFKNCASLRGIKLPESLRSIGKEAFAGCTDLEAVCLPYGAQTLGSGIFRGCERLVHIFYPATMEQWKKLKLDSIGKNTHIYCVDGVVNGS